MNTQRIDRLAGVPCETPAQSDGRKIKIGDGFEAQSYRHADFQGPMDPLIMVDHFVMTQPTFGTHAHAVLFRGHPFCLTLVQRGPFVMGNAAELDVVEAAYRAGRLGSID